MRIVKLDDTSKKNILNDLLKRSPNNYDKYADSVNEILQNVKENGNKALFDYTLKFDKADISAENIKVTKEEIEEAYNSLENPELVDIIKKSLKNIKDYHEKQKQYSWFDSKTDGSILGQKVTALARVGVYVPGGKAAYPSSVLMNVIPAKVAGVDEIVMVTPPGKDGKVNPNTLVAANEAGGDVIYKVGGAQAIAALAYGTESIKKVDKIVGPGNIYVALAKKAVFGYVSIDSVAGPSEIMVIADESGGLDGCLVNLNPLVEIIQKQHLRLVDGLEGQRQGLGGFSIYFFVGSAPPCGQLPGLIIVEQHFPEHGFCLALVAPDGQTCGDPLDPPLAVGIIKIDHEIETSIFLLDRPCSFHHKPPLGQQACCPLLHPQHTTSSGGFPAGKVLCPVSRNSITLSFGIR